MPRPSKRTGSKDTNHDEIVAAFESLGCTVADLALSGVADFPDIVVGIAGGNHLVEIKYLGTAYGRKGQTAGQRGWAERWRGGPVYVVSTVEEVVILVTNLRRNLK